MNKLPLDSIRLLTSSQVITSPSSVVKELVENAFDAGATTLDVKLDKFGLEKIEVRDNGCGIKQGDTEFMAQQHYTSKISRHEDLQMLETYGFRGEALGSLCQVANVSIITRTEENPVAVLYALDHNGKVCSTKLTHDGIGTTVVASDLFQNFPVRKQCFQSTKKSKEELRKVEELLMAYGLIIPEVRITLRVNKNLVWQKNKSSDTKTALVDVFGINIVNQLAYFEYCDDDLQFTMQCFVPKIDSDPQLMWRSSDERSFIFINKRYVIWKELSQILKKQCVLKNNEASSGKYPLCVVSVCLSSQDVDANVEPNKTKVIINHKEEVLAVLAKELCKIYDGDELQAGTNKETRDTNDEGIDLDQTTEVRAQETSEVLSNETTSRPECERLIDAELTSERTAAIEALGNSECRTGEVSNQTRNNDDSQRLDLSDLMKVNEAVDCTASVVESDEVKSNDGVIAEDNSTSIQNDRTSDLYCKDKQNINLEKTKNASTTFEKQNSLSKSGDLDKLLEDFINDSDDLDDSLLDIDVVQPNEGEWSKGQGLTDKNGKEVEPVKVLRQSFTMNQKSTNNGKRKHGFDKDCSSSKSDRPCKKNKKHSLINGQSLLTSAQQSPRMSSCTTTRKRKTKEVAFALSSLKQLAARERSSVTTKSDDIQLIKRLDPWGVWLVHKKRKLFILNPYRIQELLLYKRLLATHILPKEKLGKAIVLDERILGGPSRYSLLKKLVFKNNQGDNLCICCDDKRLLANGFEITGRLDGESGEISLSLVKMNTTIPYFGVSDIVELLDLIKDKSIHGLENGKKHDLASCRTSKVCNFLKDEVARISRSLPSRMSDTDIVELLKNMNEHLNENENTCVHNRPLLHRLISY